MCDKQAEKKPLSIGSLFCARSRGDPLPIQLPLIQNPVSRARSRENAFGSTPGNRNMAQPVVNCAGVDPVVGKLIAAAGPEHVEVNWKGEAGTRANDLHKPVDGVRRERGAALGGEHVTAVRIFLAQRRQMRNSSPLIG